MHLKQSIDILNIKLCVILYTFTKYSNYTLNYIATVYSNFSWEKVN